MLWWDGSWPGGVHGVWRFVWGGVSYDSLNPFSYKVHKNKKSPPNPYPLHISFIKIIGVMMIMMNDDVYVPFFTIYILSLKNKPAYELCSVYAYRTKKIKSVLIQKQQKCVLCPLPFSRSLLLPPAPAHIFPGNPARSHDSWIWKGRYLF